MHEYRLPSDDVVSKILICSARGGCGIVHTVVCVSKAKNGRVGMIGGRVYCKERDGGLQ